MKLKEMLFFTALIGVFLVPNSVQALELIKDANSFSVAVVDIPMVVDKSPQITAIKLERQNKLNDLEAFVVNARKEVAAVKGEDEKKALEEKFNKELNVRKDNIDREFARKLADIDRDITAIIRVKARKLGHEITLVKGSVIDGGTDITNEIIKDLK